MVAPHQQAVSEKQKGPKHQASALSNHLGWILMTFPQQVLFFQFFIVLGHL